MPESTFTDAELREAYTNQRDFWGDPERPAEQILIEIYNSDEVNKDQDAVIAIIDQLSRSQTGPYALSDLRKIASRLSATYENWEAVGDEYLEDHYGKELLLTHSSRIDVEGIGKDVARDQMRLYVEGADGRIYYFSSAR